MNLREAINIVTEANMSDSKKHAAIIDAMRSLGFDHFELRGRDALDFREVSVTGLRQVLSDLYDVAAAGKVTEDVPAEDTTVGKS